MKLHTWGYWIAVGAVITITLFAVSRINAPLNSINKSREQEEKARFHEARMKYEFDMLKDPKTGKIPRGIFEKEIAFARTLPVKSEDNLASSVAGSSGSLVLNNYIPAGPNNIGGRTRAAAYDRRYNGVTNRVIIAGCVSGGIMRSTDGGNSWKLVTPNGDIHNFTALAQDPTNPDVWYAGGGEAYGNSASEIGATYMGHGVWKSVNNGASWTKLTLSISGFSEPSAGFQLEVFDHPFDFVHNIAVNPTNGHVYIAGHRRLIRSTDRGSSFQLVFQGNAPATSATGQMDVTVSVTGRVFLAVNGGNPDQGMRGVWHSPSGDLNSFTRVAGGQTLGVDSVSEWRGNDYSGGSKRILLDLAPSNNNIAYVFYDNGLSNDDDKKPEADLFRTDISGTTFTWSNRSNNLPDYPQGDLSGSDPLSLQNGYNMVVKVKPNDPNTVFIGGTNLYRSTDGFATKDNIAWINGYRQSPLDYGRYPNGHPDQHQLTFNPTNADEAICGDDGGIRQTTNISAGGGGWPQHPVSWRQLPNYQTLQYYNVAIDPSEGRNNFAGGSQDNGVTYRDKTGVLGTPAVDSNNHRQLISADGAFVGISSVNGTDQYLFESIQYGSLRRVRLASPPTSSGEIRPIGLTTTIEGEENEFGEFVTNLRLVADNSNDLYYVNFNRLFRTTSASTVTSSSGWTELTGVAQTVNPSNPTSGRNIGIRGMTFSRGPYMTTHALYFGTTNGKIFRLDDPRNAAATAIPVNITPAGLTGNVQDIAVNPNNDDEVLAIVSNYNVVSIWWTNNGKSATPTWQNAEGNLTLPSIRSCMIVVKKDAANNPVTEYYVGTSVGIYSTTNITSGAPIWQREGENVVNFSVVVSLAYRPNDNVMVLGTHGNGMFYTFLGTPNFTPNVNTGIDPITNDKNFINKVYPTLSTNIIQYQTGNIFGVKKISIDVFNIAGQRVLRRETGYQNGAINITTLARGNYILLITSDDRKYRHVQKIIKQ
ncbi:MAG: T9SS type A sorting domain-containing protein [Chitinophagaceae bacterium]